MVKTEEGLFPQKRFSAKRHQTSTKRKHLTNLNISGWKPPTMLTDHLPIEG
jgi:hypothetical protein